MQDFIFYESFSRIISNNDEENQQLQERVGEVQEGVISGMLAERWRSTRLFCFLSP